MDLVVLDAGIVIALLDARDLHHGGARAALARAINQERGLALPASAYAEVLVGPIRHSAESAVVVDELIDELPITVVPIERSVARHAAQLRAEHATRLRLPDALVVATALSVGAREILTTDARWPELPIAVTVV